jgi:hypothetical protein
LPDPWTKVPLWLKGILRTQKKKFYFIFFSDVNFILHFFFFVKALTDVCDVLDHKVTFSFPVWWWTVWGWRPFTLMPSLFHRRVTTWKLFVG